MFMGHLILCRLGTGLPLPLLRDDISSPSPPTSSSSSSSSLISFTSSSYKDTCTCIIYDTWRLSKSTSSCIHKKIMCCRCTCSLSKAFKVESFILKSLARLLLKNSISLCCFWEREEREGRKITLYNTVYILLISWTIKLTTFQTLPSSISNWEYFSFLSSIEPKQSNTIQCNIHHTYNEYMTHVRKTTTL